MANKSTAARTPSPNGRLPARAVAVHLEQAQHVTLDLPVLGTLRLPRPEQLAYYGAVGVLVALEVIDWPIAVLVAVGHALTHQQHSRFIQQLGCVPGAV